MQPNFRIQLLDEHHAELQCNACAQGRRMPRAELKALVAGNLFHEHCPSCGAAYYDWSPAPVASVLDNEFTRLGKTVAAVLQQRGRAPDGELEANIGFILLDKEQRLGLATFSTVERHVHAVQGLLREVNNGGFAQFFGNASGELSADLLPALRAMGASAALQAIAGEALTRFGQPSGLDEASRQAHLDGLASDLWDDLDDAFYSLDEDESGRLLDYIGAHLEQFDA
jgi:hypothetical protein